MLMATNGYGEYVGVPGVNGFGAIKLEPTTWDPSTPLGKWYACVQAEQAKGATSKQATATCKAMAPQVGFFSKVPTAVWIGAGVVVVGGLAWFLLK